MTRVLVVEDEEQLAQNIKVWLECSTNPFEVVSTGSGEDASQLLADQRFDLLLTDIRLPGIDGIELVRIALDLQPRLRVIVMSAFGAPELSSLATRCGEIRFLHKPLDLDELHDIVLEVVRSHEGWSGTVGGLDLLDLTQLVALSRKSAVVRVSSGNEEGVLVFVHGELRHAQSASTEGDHAFLTMTSWPAGTFSEVPGARPSSYPANVRQSLANLMLNAAVQRDERLGAPSDAASSPGRTGGKPEARAGHDLWSSLVARWPEVVRMLIATPPELEEGELQTALDALAVAVGAPPPAEDVPLAEPAFLRLRPGAGGTFQVTWLPLRRRHRYLFETLAATADVAILLLDQGCGDPQGWLDALPPKVQRVVVSREEHVALDLVTLLRGVATGAQ